MPRRKVPRASPPVKTDRQRKHRAGTTAESKEQRRKLFAQAFIANGENRTQAAIAAGYSAKTAGAAGSRLLKEPKTRDLVEEGRKELRMRFGVTAENVTRQLGAIVNFDPRRMFKGKTPLDISDYPDDVAYAVAGVEVTRRGDGENAEVVTKHKIWDKNAAIAHAIKILGLSKERLPFDPPTEPTNAEDNLLDAARRVAFTLAMGAAVSVKRKETPATKKPAKQHA